jgi:hypothetical protein
MTTGRFALVTVVAVVGAMTAGPAGAAAADTFGPPTVTPLGTFGGIAYVQYDGMFEGETSTGAFRVPYRISAPVDTSLSNQSVVVEAPHFNVGVGARNLYLTPGFLFSRGFVHAGVGWSTVGNRIIDPTAPGTFIDGGFHELGGKVDDEIITEFARALSTTAMVGTVSRRYLTGLSDSTIPVLRLIESGRAAGVFDFALPFTADKGFDPQTDIAADRFPGKLIVVNTEFEDSRGYLDRGVTPSQYRFFAVAGSPHIPDHINPPSRTTGTTPATFAPALRAHFAQGHDWVRRGQAPPLSTQLRTTRGNTVDRDASGNAITVDRTGRIVPRLPFVDLGEARFIAEFIGSYDQVRTIQQLGFATHQAYLKAFGDRVSAYTKAGFILNEDAAVMRQRAALCPPSTYTETYRDHYTEFATVTPCGD